MKPSRPLLKTVAFGFAVAGQLVLYITFVMAYMNPDKNIMVYINRYGEANIELMLMTLSVMLTLWFFYGIINDFVKAKNYNRIMNKEG